MRPEIKEMLWRWREVGMALIVVCLFLWFATSSFGVMRWIGFGLVALSVILIIAAIQRARFSGKTDGRGVVDIDEGVVSYMLPFGGGQIEVENLTCVLLLPADAGPAHWQLEATGQSALQIPLDAFGAEKLFDVFVSLKGIETERMLRQIKQTPDQPVVIWQNRTVALH